MIAGLGQAAGPAPSSGIAAANMEASVRPQNDFYQYVNGKWLQSARIPSDQPMWGSFVQVGEEAQAQLHAIVEKAAAPTPAPGSDARRSDARRIGDFYASFMDEARIEQLGLTPLKGELERIAALKDKSALPALLAHLKRIGVKTPFALEIEQDHKDATRYAASIAQSGLGMPGRDFYLHPEDARMAAAKAKYEDYVAKILALTGAGDPAAGDPAAGDPATSARAVVGFETELAKAHWTPVELRDPVKAYNKVLLADLDRIAPGFGWAGWLEETGLSARTAYVIVGQPTYLKAFAEIAGRTPLDTVKAYLTLRLVTAYGDFLSKQVADPMNELVYKTLFGMSEVPVRWKRGLQTIEQTQGEALGKLYVAEHFSAERKRRIETMVRNLLAAFKGSIDQLDWMSPTTKQQAQGKLAKFTYKIGYPDKWRDYAGLEVKRDDLVGNVKRAREFEYAYRLNKLGTPIDRAEWGMTPQTINAEYTAERNDITFPAAILQPPFFDPDADDAVNYGAIGAVIGHEISHGFDDEGGQFDGDGNLRDWWTADDRKRFEAKAKMLVEQFNAFEPLPGYKVNGELTVGENIADDSGLAIAYKAYKISLNGKKSPVIGGFTGEQRFYMGWAQVWRSKMRDEFMVRVLKTDPHAPGEFRVNGALRNETGFYEAFGVKPGDKLYLAPKDRVIIW